MNRRQRSRFPLCKAGGGRAIKKNDAEGHQSWRGRGGQFSKRVCNAIRDISSEMTTPSAPQRWLRSIFLMVQPPLLCQGGDSASLAPLRGSILGILLVILSAL